MSSFLLYFCLISLKYVSLCFRTRNSDRGLLRQYFTYTFRGHRCSLLLYPWVRWRLPKGRLLSRALRRRGKHESTAGIHPPPCQPPHRRWFDWPLRPIVHLPMPLLRTGNRMSNFDLQHLSWQSIEDARWRDGGRYQPLFQTDPGTCPINQVLT